MADFLTNLVGRATGETPKLSPVVAPLFALQPPADEQPPAAALEGERPLLEAGLTNGRPRSAEAAAQPPVRQGVVPGGQTEQQAEPLPVNPPPPPAAKRGRPSTPQGDDAAEEGQRADLPRQSPAARRVWSKVRAIDVQGPLPEDEPEPRERSPLRPQRREAPRRMRFQEQPPASEEGQLLMPLAGAEGATWAAEGEGGDAAARGPVGRARAAQAAADASRRAGSGEAAAPPTIEVTIGRVEVRAVRPPEARQPAPRKNTPAPGLSLEEYLRKERGGRP